MANLVNVHEAAKLLSLNKATLYRAVERGELPHYRMGRAVRFDIDELRAWMKSASQQPAASKPVQVATLVR